MASISIAIIAYNEEKNIERCLKSCAWADETVLVDCGSTDRTNSIAARFPVRLYTRPNNSMVYVNKQFAADQASMDWVFILDADEEITPGLRDEIGRAIAGPPDISAYEIPRRNHYFGRWLRHGGKYPDHQLRLFRRGAARFLPLPVHERLEVRGRVARLDEPMNHFPYASAEDVQRKLGFYTEALVRSYGSKNKNRAFILVRPFSRFFSGYILKLGFLDGREGLAAALMDFRTIMSSAVLYMRRGGG